MTVFYRNYGNTIIRNSGMQLCYEVFLLILLSIIGLYVWGIQQGFL